MEGGSSNKFVSITLPSNYDEVKPKKTTWWRWWKQRSRYQRTLIYMILVIGGVTLLTIVPSTGKWRLKSSPEIENEISNKNSAAQIEMPKPVGSGEDGNNNNDKMIVDNQVPGPVVRASLDDADEFTVHDPNNPKCGKSSVAKHKGPVLFKGATNEKQEAVVKAFLHAWKGYKQYAWGHDHLKPISKSYHDWFGVGLTLVDALDTMYIMKLEKEFIEARDFVKDKMNFEINKDVNVFETTIRVLGGLLSTYHLTQDKLFLRKAIDLGDRLMPSFKSGSGIPYSDVNLFTHHSHPPQWGPDSSVSEVTTIQLEFNDLTLASGDSKFAEATNKVSQIIHDQKKLDGLVPIYINADSGKFRSFSTITLGARADSYYEYLLKQWLQTGKSKDFLLRDFNESVSGMVKHLYKKSEPNGLVFFGELTNSDKFKPKMDHLVCYLPSVLMLGHQHGLPESHARLAEDLMYTCYQMYVQMPTSLAPEIAYFNVVPGDTGPDIIVKYNDAHNLLRPETVESLWYLYYFSGNKTYQDWGWQIFQAFEKISRVGSGGYTSIDNVKSLVDTKPRDMMESFFLGETLKYFYLLFSDDQSEMSLENFVFNSEAHPLPIYEC